MAEPAARHEDLPHAADAEQPHRVDAPVPVVEVADDAGAGGVGGPDGEVDALGRADGHRMGAELVVDAGVVAFAEEVEVVVGDDAAVAIRVVDLGDVAAGIRDLEAVVDVHAGVGRLGERRFVDADRMASGHRDRRQAVADDADGFGGGKAGADDEPAALDVRTEDRERIGVECAGDGVEGRGHRAASKPAPVKASAVRSSHGAYIAAA